MATLRALFKDTAIYGMSSIVGRFLTYLLVPLYTYYMPKASGDYGISVNLYAYTALVLVVLTFGMETTFFRFANKEKDRGTTVLTTSLVVVGTLSVLFFAVVCACADPLCARLGYGQHHDYVLIMAGTVAVDAVRALPFCWLRYQKKAWTFASLQLANIVLTVVLNVVFFVVLHRTSVFYIFAINLFCSLLLLLVFVPLFVRLPWRVDSVLLKKMVHYAAPLVVLGIAGILNQTADKILYPLVCPEHLDLLGEYGACAKIAMIMALITQAFRYAYEPIVFATVGSKDEKEYYAVAMKYFVIGTLVAFLVVVAYLDILQYIIGGEYRGGLRVVPIVMLAEIMMGVYFNLSFWYKTIDKTLWGALFSVVGCAALILFNLLLIPRMGYMACAWGGVVGYGIAMVLSFVVGQHYNAVAYPLRDIGTYVVLAGVLYAAMVGIGRYTSPAMHLVANTLLLLAGAVIIVRKEHLVAHFLQHK